MMKKMKCCIVLVVCLLATVVKTTAQVTVDAKLDSAGIFIGQRIGVTL